MFRWLPYAMVRITGFFVAGIVFAIHWPEFVGALEVVSIAAGFAFFAACYFLQNNETRSVVTGFLGLTVMFASGYSYAMLRTAASDPQHIINYNSPIRCWTGTVASDPERRANSWKLEVDVRAIQSDTAWRNARGTVLLIIPGTDSIRLVFGDEVIIHSTPEPVNRPQNPYEFDYRDYLRFRNIYHQDRVERQEIRLTSHAVDHGLPYFSHRARAVASARIDRNIAGDQERVIARALVLGITNGLDNDLRDAYAASGAMHILSVSGLHVGIVYGLILFVLRPMQRLSWGRWITAIVGILALWLYAFITGLSPSVLRAAAMFSSLAIGRLAGREGNVYNTLGSSCFFLLIYDPFLVMSVGFQLSYLAVAGIVLLYRPIYLLWEPSTVVADKVWQLISVSIAAQAVTFPLGFYYFHQFPAYFLLSNLIVVPLSSVVLVLGIVLVTVGDMPVVSLAVGAASEFLIGVLNGSVRAIENLPGSLIEGVVINAPQAWLLLAMLICLMLLIERRRFVYIAAMTVMCAIFSALEWQSYDEAMLRNQLVVYSLPRRTVIEWTTRGQAFLLGDSLAESSPDVKLHILPNRIHRRVVSIRSCEPCKRDIGGVSLLSLGGVRVIWLRTPVKNLPPVKADYFIVSRGALTTKMLRAGIPCKTIVLDASNSAAYSRRMKEQAELLGFYVHSVQADGAFVVNL